MKFKVMSPISILASAVLFLAIGCMFLFSSNIGIQLLIFMVGLALLVAGVFMIASYFFKRDKKLLSCVLGALLYFVLAAIIFTKPDWFSSSLAFITGIWAFINFTWRLILCIQLYRNEDKSFWRTCVECLFSLVFALLFLFNPSGNVRTLCIFIGIYLILYGFSMTGDFIRELLKWDLEGKHVKKYIRWTPPIFLTAFLPQKIIEKINKSVAAGEISQRVFENENTSAEHKETKLQVFIHMAPQIAMGFGHMDICFDRKVYSYGTYDAAKQYCNGLICDGVLAKMSVDSYIDHCLKVDKEHIISFSIWLSEKQEEAMRQAIEKLQENCVRWKCPAEETGNKDCTDPASLFYYTADAEFYKFKKGKFKTYFAVSTNCVLLADTLIKAAGIDAIRMNGIVTPGTYLSFLNDEFLKKNSIVIKRTVLI